MSKTIFIGHGRSEVWHQLKDFLSERMHFRCTEFNAEEPAGTTTTERLQNLLKDAGFAFLVMTAEDIHADSTSHARENVIHEAGLFQGHLGFKRAIILLEEGCTQFSNIHGLIPIDFPKGDMKPAFERIRGVLEREGINRIARPSEGVSHRSVAEPAAESPIAIHFPDDALQVWTPSNLDVRDSVVTMTNMNTAVSLCVNTYIFNDVGLMIACCSCLVQPNSLASFSCRNDLISNTLTPAVSTSILIKLLASRPIAGRTCDPGSVSPDAVANGLLAWGKVYGSDKTPFSRAELSPAELETLTKTSRCIQAIGGGFGICRACRAGGFEPKPIEDGNRS